MKLRLPFLCLLCLLSYNFVLIGQTGTLKPVLKIDTVFTNPYGLISATIEFGTTSSDTVEWITTITDKI